MQFAARRLGAGGARHGIKLGQLRHVNVVALPRVAGTPPVRFLKHKPEGTPRTGPSGRDQEGDSDEVFMELHTPSVLEVAETSENVITAAELARVLRDDADSVVLLDVRTADSILRFDTALPESRSLPLATLDLSPDATAEETDLDDFDEDAVAATAASRWLADVAASTDKAFLGKYGFSKDEVFGTQKKVVVISNIGTRSKWVADGANEAGFQNFESLLGGVRVYRKYFPEN